MPVFSGNTSTNTTSTAYNIPYRITDFILANKSGGAITINVGVLYGSTFAIIPLNLVLSDGDTFYSDDEVLLLAGHQLYLTTTGSVDYYFSLE